MQAPAAGEPALDGAAETAVEASVEGTAAEAGVDVAGDDPLDEQAARTSARPAMSALSERRDIRSSL
jgi:hypothetical protein